MTISPHRRSGVPLQPWCLSLGRTQTGSHRSCWMNTGRCWPDWSSAQDPPHQRTDLSRQAKQHAKNMSTHTQANTQARKKGKDNKTACVNNTWRCVCLLWKAFIRLVNFVSLPQKCSTRDEPIHLHCSAFKWMATTHWVWIYGHSGWVKSTVWTSSCKINLLNDESIIHIVHTNKYTYCNCA